MKKAFTLVEVLVTLGILTLIAIPSIVALYQVRINQSLSFAITMMETDLKKSRTYAREQRDESSWGVVSISDTDYEIKKKKDAIVSTYSIGKLPNGTRISSGFSIWFDQGTGETNDDFEIELNAGGRSKSVLISKNGLIEQL